MTFGISPQTLTARVHAYDFDAPPSGIGQSLVAMCGQFLEIVRFVVGYEPHRSTLCERCRLSARLRDVPGAWTHANWNER